MATQTSDIELPSVDLGQTADGDRGRRIEEHTAIRRFVTSGKAIGTLVGTSTRYTFKVERSEPSDRYPHAAYFVSYLAGPDNTSDYVYAGLLDERSGVIRLTRKSTLTDQSGPVRAWNWYMPIVWGGRMPLKGEFWHVGRCGRCGRVLTVPASIASGLGPECAARMEAGE